MLNVDKQPCCGQWDEPSPRCHEVLRLKEKIFKLLGVGAAAESAPAATLLLPSWVTLRLCGLGDPS